MALHVPGRAWSLPWVRIQQPCGQKHGKKYLSIQKIDPDIRFILVLGVGVGLVRFF